MSAEPKVQETGANLEVAAPVAEESQTDRMVPLSALESERATRQRTEDELKMIKEHLNLLNARQSQPQSQSQPQTPQMDDEDVMTYGDFKKIAGEFQRDISGRLTEMQMKQQYPDYQEIVTKYLPDVLKSNPDLYHDLNSNPNFYRAYYIAKNSEGYRRDHVEQKRNADAERLVQNLQKPGSLSEIGGASPINMAKRYKDMSDEEFKKEVNRNMGYS